LAKRQTHSVTDRKRQRERKIVRQKERERERMKETRVRRLSAKIFIEMKVRQKRV